MATGQTNVAVTRSCEILLSVMSVYHARAVIHAGKQLKAF